MAAKGQIAKYKKDLAEYKKLKRRAKGWAITTVIFTILFTLGISGIALYLTFTRLPSLELKQIYYVLTCLAICVGCAISLSIGTLLVIETCSGLRYSSEADIGIWAIIFCGILPGIFYFIAINCSDIEIPTDPVWAEKQEKNERIARKQREAEEAEEERKAAERAERERRRKQREAEDPRNYFVVDEDDVGELPDPNLVDFEGLKKAVEAEAEDE